MFGRKKSKESTGGKAVSGLTVTLGISSVTGSAYPKQPAYPVQQPAYPIQQPYPGQQSYPVGPGK